MRLHEERARKEMFRFLGFHLAVGSFGGCFIGVLILWIDLAGLRTLLWKSEDAFLMGFLLFASLILTFGAIGMGIGIMGKSEEREG